MADLRPSIRYVNHCLHRLLPPEQILLLSDRVGHRFRRRKLDPAPTIALTVLMILGANASLASARIGAGARFSTAALCRARMRLPLPLLAALGRWVLEQSLSPDGPPRLLLLDASNYYLPDTPSLRRRYRQPGQKRHATRRADYPQMRVLCLFDLHSGLLVDQFDFPSDRHESPMLRHVLGSLRPGDTLVFDRGFVSFANFCLLRGLGIHFIARLPLNLHAGDAGPRRYVRAGRRSTGSAAVTWDKPARRSEGMSRWRRLEASIQLRQVNAKIRHRRGRGRGPLVLISDLPEVSSRQLSRWYRRRWEIETDLRHLKGTLKLEFFTSKTVQGVKRELLLRAIAYNLVRQAMLRAAKTLGVWCGRISFGQVIRVLLGGDRELLKRLTPIPPRQRTTRPRRLKYRGKNFRLLTKAPNPQRRIA